MVRSFSSIYLFISSYSLPRRKLLVNNVQMVVYSSSPSVTDWIQSTSVSNRVDHWQFLRCSEWSRAANVDFRARTIETDGAYQYTSTEKAPPSSQNEASRLHEFAAFFNCVCRLLGVCFFYYYYCLRGVYKKKILKHLWMIACIFLFIFCWLFQNYNLLHFNGISTACVMSIAYPLTYIFYQQNYSHYFRPIDLPNMENKSVSVLLHESVCMCNNTTIFFMMSSHSSICNWMILWCTHSKWFYYSWSPVI